MTLISSRTATVLVAAGLLALAGCGGAEEPAGARASGGTGRIAPTSTPPAAATARGTGIDRAFVAAMVAHHRSAIAMARIARRQATGAFVKRFARDIVMSRSEEISALRREDKALQLAGVRRGSLGLPAHMNAMSGDLRTLRAASPFDPAFLRMMTVHHQGAIEIARVETARGRDPELRTLAARIISAHRSEMRAMREQLGKPAARPARPVPPTPRDPRSGSPDMPGIDDSTGLPTQTE